MLRSKATIAIALFFTIGMLTSQGQIVSTTDANEAVLVTSLTPGSIFSNPACLLNVWVNDPIPLLYYTEEDISRQKQINKNLPERIITGFPKTRNVTLTKIDLEEITPLTWKWIDFELFKPDCTLAKINLRRPNWWIKQMAADSIGKKIYLNMPELGIDGWAMVMSIRVNQIDTRLWEESYEDNYPGRPVTGKFEHESSNVYELKFDQMEEPVGVTGEHPFWSNDRNTWACAEQLKIGENVQTHEGSLELLSRSKKVGRYKVFNIEVFRDHTYFVSTNMILVHNNCKLLRIGTRKISDIVKTDNTLSLQMEIDPIVVEKMANEMVNKKFNWNKMKDPIRIIEFSDGKRLISEGHNRFLAAELAGKEIPWDNPWAVRITKTAYKSTDYKYARPWKDVHWLSFDETR